MKILIDKSYNSHRTNLSCRDLRIPARASHLRQQFFDHQFDYTSRNTEVFRRYDGACVFYIPLTPFDIAKIDKLKIFSDDGEEIAFKTNFEERLIEVRFLCDARVIFLSWEVGVSEAITISDFGGAECSDANVIVTLQKDNNPNWIGAWIRHYFLDHDVTHFFIYDNCSIIVNIL